MSDVAFINSYNEIVFENFLAVLKQNLMFQTQLKLLEPKVARLNELEQKLSESGNLGQDVSRLQQSVQSLTQTTSEKLLRIEQLEKQLAESDEAVREIGRLRSTVQSLTADLQAKTTQLQQQAGADADRHRIQSALNEKMRESESLRASVEVLNREIQTLSAQATHGKDAIETNQALRTAVSALEKTVQDQTQYIQSLEELLPTSKRKKLGLPIESRINTTTETLTAIEPSGGIF